MSKEEILTKEFDEKEFVQPKSHKKVIIAISITASLAIIAITTLLVGYFKFDWFKSEVYNIDAKITRNLHQASYFTETKTIKVKYGFTDGVTEEREATIYTNFMVFMIDKAEFLNTAVLILLDVQVKSYKELKKAISFDIFDEEKVKEVIANPDGSKYPLALFKFYENGTIDDIQLPSNIDEYNAHTIIELIEDVIPKLTRNRTEDISNGLQIKNKKGKKNSTLVESHSPREIEEFRDSNFTKSVERVIEDEKLTSIQSNTSLSLETKLREGEIPFGFQSFGYEQKSKIISTLTKDEKEKVELIHKLSKRFSFINSKDLIESFSKKEDKDEEYVIKESNAKDASNLRKLQNGDATVNIATLNIAGRQIKIKARIGASGQQGYAYMRFECGNYPIEFGQSGISGQRSWNPQATLFTFPFPPMPVVTLNLRVGGDFGISFSVDWQGTGTLSVSAGLKAYGDVTAGDPAIIGLQGGVVGTFLSGTLTAYIKNGVGSKSCSFYTGQLQAFIKGSLAGHSIDTTKSIFDGWSTSYCS